MYQYMHWCVELVYRVCICSLPFFFVCLDYLLSGITQLAYLSISPGSFRLNPGDKLSLETSDSLTVTTESDDNMLVVKETEDGQPYEFKVHLFHERENSMTSEAQVRGILKLHYTFSILKNM